MPLAPIGPSGALVPCPRTYAGAAAAMPLPRAPRIGDRNRGPGNPRKRAPTGKAFAPGGGLSPGIPRGALAFAAVLTPPPNFFSQGQKPNLFFFFFFFFIKNQKKKP